MSDPPPTRERTRDRDTATPSETTVEETDTETETEQNTVTCPECEGVITTDHSRGERSCEDCGLVIEEENIDRGPEWRAYNKSERDEKSRVGPARTELRHDHGMSSTIDWKNQDAYGNQLSASKRAQMQRLRTWDQRAKQSSGDRGLAYANGEIMRMGSALGTPKSIRETAGSLYRQAQEAGLVPGRSIEGMASAVLYIALRVHEEPRSLDEIAQVSRVERKPISRAHRYICRELDIPLKPTNPVKYIPRFAGEVGVSQDIQRTAEEFIQEIDGHHMSGCDPTVLAGSALYAASIVHGELVTQHSVKDAADITEVSIRNNYKQFLIYVDSVALSEEDVESIDSPIGLCKKINGEVSYNESTRKTKTKDDTDSEDYSDDDPEDVEAEPDETVDPENDGDQSPPDSDETGTPAEDNQESGENAESTGGNGDFGCDECSFTSHSQLGVNIHAGRVHSETSDETSSDSDDEDDNEDEDSEDVEVQEEGEFPCQYCLSAFDSNRGLRVHQGKEHDGATNDNQSQPAESEEYPDSEYNFQCPICKFVFGTYQGVGIHIGRSHEDEDVDESRCREACAVDPTEHLVTSEDTQSTVYPDDAYNFKCQHCGRVFETYQGLSTHIGHQHSDVQKHDRDAYAVDPMLHPATEDAETSQPGTVDEEPEVDSEFREYVVDTLAEIDHDSIGPAVIQLAKTLLLVGGRNYGIDTYRGEASAVGAALYAAQELFESEHASSLTQAEIAELVGVSPIAISHHYAAYIELFNDGDYEMSHILARNPAAGEDNAGEE